MREGSREERWGGLKGLVTWRPPTAVGTEMELAEHSYIRTVSTVVLNFTIKFYPEGPGKFLKPFKENSSTTADNE